MDTFLQVVIFYRINQINAFNCVNLLTHIELFQPFEF